MPVFLGILAASLVPIGLTYVVPSPAPSETANDKLFRWSLIAGLVISGFTIYSYLKGR